MVGARVQMIVEDVPADVHDAVDAHAALTGASINDTVVGLLAARYGVAYEPTGYPRTHPTESTTWVLRMPAALRDAISQHALARPGDSRRGVILLTLAEALDLPPISPRRAA